MVQRKEHPWYSFDRLLSYGAMFNFCAGGRGMGKTYDAKKRAIRKAIKRNEQFIYLRRHKTEINPAARSFFDDIIALDEFPEWDFKVMGKTAMMSPKSKREDKKREWTTIGYFVSLSTAQTQKSVSFHHVTTIIFDEFIAEHGRQYLPDEFNLFLGFYSTVDRNQDKTVVLFCANSVSIMNPYFTELDIRPDQLKEFSTHRDGYVACQFPDSNEFKNSVYNTKFGKFIQGTEYGRYAVENQFDDANDLMVGVKPSTAKHHFNLETKYGTVSIWLDKPTQQYYVQQKLPKFAALNFTLLPERMSPEKQLVTFSDKLLAYLRTAFRNGMVTFDKPSTRNAFVEISKR